MFYDVGFLVFSNDLFLKAGYGSANFTQNVFCHFFFPCTYELFDTY